SMVGPRPERPYFVEQYTRELPQFEYRHKIECGLTGLAQVEGKYSTQPGDKLCYDLIYAQNRSTLLDLIIILRTVKVLLQKGKAS
ncbi:MAG: sugar transferase, partial [Syntrophomonadaceae bacterium]|nr:sugar transferase [Syntrophomonadaceae bacterium]